MKKEATKSATKKVVAAEKPKSAPKKVVTKKTEPKSVSFAVIKLGGVQLKVEEGKTYDVEKLNGVKGDKIQVTDVLLYTSGETVKLGKPFVEGAKVTLSIDSQKKNEKIDGFKFTAKSRYRRRFGHRALMTRVEVVKIEA